MGKFGGRANGRKERKEGRRFKEESPRMSE